MKRNLLSIIGPGILVAATGIGAGDLATAAFNGLFMENYLPLLLED